MNATWDPVMSLDGAQRDELYDLLNRHFLGVSPRQFAEDLHEKTLVVRLWEDQRLVGFSTIAHARMHWLGTELTAVWSGDTIVEPSAWGGALLPAAWLAAVRSLHQGHSRLAWCLICSGVRTWRMMPVFYRSFAPTAAAADLTGLRDLLATYRYGARFDPSTGVVRLAAPQQLREHLRALPGHLDEDPVAAKFASLNPGHVGGDELACATWIEPDNLTPAGARIWRLADRLLAQA